MINILIPMSGLGSRFVAAGYKDPKPLISVFDKRMIEVVVNNIGLIGNYIYIVQKSHCDKYDLKNFLTALTPGCTIIDIDYMTEGAGRLWQKAPRKVLGPDERVSVDDAIRAVTIDAAYGMFSDDKIGSLEVGKQADLVVLEKNPRKTPIEQIRNIKVRSTWIDGKQQSW